MRKLIKPPRTLRYCINCEKNVLFDYDKIIGHSKCSKCGFRYAKEIKEGVIIKRRFIKTYTNKKIDLLNSMIKTKNQIEKSILLLEKELEVLKNDKS